MRSSWTSFLKKGVWKLQTENLSPLKAFGIHFLRFCLLVGQGFTKGQISQGAASLTYYTLLALVPVLALALGIAKGFLLERVFEKWLLDQFPEQAIITSHILRFAQESLQKTREGWLAGIGVLLLFWSSIKILMNIENGMNMIWEVEESRPLARKFVDYMALLFFCPIIIFLTSALSVFLSTELKDISSKLFGDINPLILPILWLIPLSLTALLFTFLYIFIPNTRVHFIPALIAGVITAVIYQAIQWLYFYFQIGVSGYNAIYGTFAALPLFLIWLHLSWMVVLSGAKIAFALQNMNAYALLTEDAQMSHRLNTILSLQITHFCVQKFCSTSPPPSDIEISKTLKLPLSLTHHLLIQLVKSKVLSIVKRPDKEEGYCPARSVETLTIKGVIDMIERGGEHFPLTQSQALTSLLKSLASFDVAIAHSGANLLLKDL